MKTLNSILTITIMALLPMVMVGQTSVDDALATTIQNQSYLKLQSTVDCASAFTSIEKRICANLEFQREQREMDEILNNILSFYNSETMGAKAEALIAEQKEWQATRLENCISQNGEYDENLISEHHLITLADITAERRDALAKVASQLDEGMLFGATAARGKDKDK